MGKKKFDRLAQPTESKGCINSKGYEVVCVRGEDSVNNPHYIPQYMNGIDFRNWNKEMKSEVDAWRNFECEGEPNHPDYVEVDKPKKPKKSKSK